MMSTKTIIHSPKYISHAYTIALIASIQLQDQVSVLQDEILSNLGSSVWVTPANGLHATLLEIIQTKDYEEDTKDRLFKKHEQEYRTLPKRIITGFQQQTVLFDTIEASQNAIIIRASDSSFLNSLRKELNESVRLPNETKDPPDITHSTIARFSEEVDLSRVQELIASLEFEHQETVEKFHLVTDLVPPDFNYKTLEVFPLSGAQ